VQPERQFARAPVTILKGAAMNEEGWYVDSYGLHEARWISDGAPTTLVRDGGLETQDPPPDTPPPVPSELLAETDLTDGGDLRRADRPRPRP